MKGTVERSSQSEGELWWLRSLFRTTLAIFAGACVIALLGLAQQLGWLPVSTGHAQTEGETGVVYTCPMHPQIRQPSPGRCPICGMELVPAGGNGEDKDLLGIHISPAARRVANIQTAQAKMETPKQAISTIGAIAYDESLLATISAYVDGRIEKLFADYTGVRVKKGDHLVILYSPTLYSAQVEYLESKKGLKQMSTNSLPFVLATQRKLIAASRRNLAELGMTETQIKELENSGRAKSRLTIYAPLGGTVIARKTAEGDYVKTGQVIYKIADLSSVWLLLELFPEDASRIRYGQLVKARVQSLPGRDFTGRIVFIDPVVDKKTRTVSVRVEMDNKNGLLRPGDYARASIQIPIGEKGKVYDSALADKWISPMHPQVIEDKPGKCRICGMDLVPTTKFGYSKTPLPQPKALVVPRNAVLHVGKNNVVYVETEPGRFEIRPVVVGPILRDKIVILKGIEEGEEVATSGNFLIDSQMQLAGKPSLIDPTRAHSAKPGPLHLKHFSTQEFAGRIGQELEDLFAAYFTIQKSMADDEKPSAQPVETLVAKSKALLKGGKLPRKLDGYFKTIATKSAHLHHLTLKESRLKFQTISEAVVKLAARARAEKAKATFLHFYCPHVESGRGNWIQPAEPLANPYFGSEMLRCGDMVHQLPPHGRPHRPEEKKEHKHHKH